MLNQIVIVSKNNVIGCNNNLVFDIKEDLKRFKEITLNKTVIMGRKTFESMPFVLPKRHSVILTNDKNYTVPDCKEKITISNNFEETINYYKNLEEEVFIIGGGSIYEKSISYCDKLYLTVVDKEIDGDTFFPEIDDSFYVDSASEPIYSDTENCTFQYITYNKKH